MNCPLAGRTVLVTRPAHQAGDLVRPLEALGAQTFVLPAIGIAPLLDFTELDRALGGLQRYDWVVLTSANGVEAIHARLDQRGLKWPKSPGTRLAVIGPATAAAAEAKLQKPDLMPTEYVSEAIAEALGEVSGKRFLLARADRARKDLARILRERGSDVDEVAAYRIVAPELGGHSLPDRAPDAITLTSSAGVRGTFEALQSLGKESWFDASALICIGPVTSETVRELGYEPAETAVEYTMPGLVNAVVSAIGRAERAHV